MADPMVEDRSLSGGISRVPFWKRHILSIMIFIAVLGGLSVLVVFTMKKGKQVLFQLRSKLLKQELVQQKLNQKTPVVCLFRIKTRRFIVD